MRAADALGGQARILAIKTLTIEGYGQLAYQNGGGNITSSLDAPQKWVNINDYARVVDLEHGRSRVRQRQINDFVFAAAQNMKGVVSTQAIDGDVGVQHQRRRRRNTRARGRGARAADGVARPSGRVRPHGAESEIDGQQPPHVGRAGTGRCDHSARRQR